MTLMSYGVTRLLLAWNEGEKGALDRFVPLVSDEWRRLTRSYMRREWDNQTVQTTAIIHEAYLRLIDARRVKWENRARFFGAAARLMRQILVGFARERGYQKCGDGAEQND